MNSYCIAALLLAASAFAQETPKPPDKAADSEQQELMRALTEASSSTVDLVRALEAHLKKYPESSQRSEIERALAKAAIENKDERRIVLYGERVLAHTPEDPLLLDRVARALLTLGGRENAEHALKYARSFQEVVNKLPGAEGHEAARQNERDRGQARALLYQSRAKTVLGDREAAERLAAKSFSLYPSEEAAREWADALERLGRHEEAITHLAEAFAIPDSRATDSDRSGDRQRLGEIYRKIHGSETGMGDIILAAYDRTARLLEERRSRLRALDPNSGVTDPMDFTLTGLDGKKLALASLKGNVVILDFWATWCQPCRAQYPMYEEVKKRFHDRSDVVFLAIDTDEDRGLVAPFLEQNHWNLEVFFEGGLSRLLQVTSIPTTILFDKRGRVSSRMNGFLPDRFVDQLTERVQAALADSEDPR